MSDSEYTLTLWGDWSPGLGLRSAPLHDPAAFYGDLYAVLQRADLNILNLEGVFAPPEARPIVKDGRALPLPPEALPVLRPFHLVCLANNHIMDYGEAGLRHTLARLAENGLAWAGVVARSDAPDPPPVDLPQWLHILNAAEGEEARAVRGGVGARPLNLPALCAETARRSAAGQRVVAVLHTGREHWCYPAPYVQRACRALAEAGAALVAAHHPHVPQGTEVWEGTPIFYSLGNFALLPPSGWRWHAVGYGLEVRFLYPEAAPEAYIHPYEITPAGLRAMPGTGFLDTTLRDLSAPLPDAARMQALWEAYADDFLERCGLDELLRSAAALGGWRWGAATLLRDAASREGESSLKGRGERRLLREAARLLGAESASVGRPPRPEAVRQAAVLRNRFHTPAHRQVWLTALQRIMDGTFGSAPDWAREALSTWRLP